MREQVDRLGEADPDNFTPSSESSSAFSDLERLALIAVGDGGGRSEAAEWIEWLFSGHDELQPDEEWEFAVLFLRGF